MTVLHCPARIIDETLDLLRAGGRRGVERVVFWLAPRDAADFIVITQFYLPQQHAAKDYFHIPREGMAALMGHLRQGRLALRAQIHSHPGAAFHSCADDIWAVVRHEGALSIVVPQFGAGLAAANFMAEAAVFRLTSDDRWVEVVGRGLDGVLKITPR